MTRIVTFGHRCKRPPRKRKAVALATGRIVWQVEADHSSTDPSGDPAKPANDDHKQAIVSTARRDDGLPTPRATCAAARHKLKALRVFHREAEQTKT